MQSSEAQDELSSAATMYIHAVWLHHHSVVFCLCSVGLHQNYKDIVLSLNKGRQLKIIQIRDDLYNGQYLNRSGVATFIENIRNSKFFGWNANLSLRMCSARWCRQICCYGTLFGRSSPELHVHPVHQPLWLVPICGNWVLCSRSHEDWKLIIIVPFGVRIFFRTLDGYSKTLMCIPMDLKHGDLFCGYSGNTNQSRPCHKVYSELRRPF